MEVESFENEEVAKLLNDCFVSIKVSVNVVERFGTLYVYSNINAIMAL